MDAEIRNRYRLRFAKLSEVLPHSERSLAMVRMTDWASVRSLQSGMTDFGCGDLELMPVGEAGADLILWEVWNLSKVPQISSLSFKLTRLGAWLRNPHLTASQWHLP